MDLLDSTWTNPKRAPNVCHACMLRKKACDKALPACAFCASRRLLCRYDIPAAKKKGRRRHQPGRNFVLLQSPSPPQVHAPGKIVKQQLPSPQSEKDHPPSHDSSLCIFPPSTEESLNQLTKHFVELTKLSYDDIIDRYFQAFHGWLPVVSARLFRQEASRYREDERVPPADFAVLFLAMLLNILPTLDPSLRPTRASQELLYRTTKSAFSQAHASVWTSLRLVQAGLLIALREYTCVRPEAAYVSMATCVGLARIAGIDIAPVRTSSHAKGTVCPLVEDLEREGVAWSIAMVERLVLCEIDRRDLQPQTECLDPQCRLTTDLEPTAELNSQALKQVTILGSASADTGLFGQQKHLVSLLDRLLLILRQTASNKDTKLAKLAELDAEIRDILEVVMADLEWRLTLNCVLVAQCVRLLFLLHESVLENLPRPKSEAEHQKRDISCIGLDLVCRMTVDVAQWYGEEKIQIAMPICCFYNLREARKCMQERNRFAADESRSCDIDSLLLTEKKYRETWGL